MQSGGALEKTTVSFHGRVVRLSVGGRRGRGRLFDGRFVLGHGFGSGDFGFFLGGR